MSSPADPTPEPERAAQRRSPLGCAAYVLYRALGEGLHLLLFALLWLLGSAEYLSSSWLRWLFGPAVVVAVVALRVARRRDGPIMLYANASMILYNCMLWIGGYLYLGRLAALLFPPSFVALSALLVGRYIGRWRAAAWAVILMGCFGPWYLEMNRSSESEWFRDCAGEGERLSSRVQQLDERLHPYDIDVDPSGRYLFVSYGDVGRDGLIVRRDLQTGELHEQRTVRGVQRIDFSADGALLLSTPWGRQGRARTRHCNDGQDCVEQEGIYLLPVAGAPDELDCCGRPAGDDFLPLYDAVNTFAAVQEPGGDLLAISEIDKQVIRLDAQGRERSRLTLEGLNLYDLEPALHGRLLAVSDQQAPWVSIVDLAGGSLTAAGRIWVAPFSFGLLADPQHPDVVYLAGSLNSHVYALDVAGRRRLWRLAVGYGPRDLAIDNQRRILLAGNYFDGTVSLIDLESQRELARPFFGKLVRGVCYSPAEDRVYAATACGVRWARMQDLLDPSDTSASLGAQGLP